MPRIIVRLALLAGLFVVLLPHAAYADCVMTPYNFWFGKDTSATESTTGGPCLRYFYIGAGSYFTSISAVARPSHGTLTVYSNGARYQPRKGYKGKDSYALKVCGAGRSNRISCSVITYHTTVE